MALRPKDFKMIPDLYNVVIIGLCDISAAGCRALLGCSKEASTLKLQTSKIDMESMKSQINDEEGKIPLFSKVDCDIEKATLVSVSSQLSSGAASHFFNEVLDEVRNSKAKEIVIVAAVSIKLNSVKETDVFQVAVNCDEVKDIKCLLDNFLIKDFMINMAIQFSQVESIPLRCFLTQGYRIGSGKPNHQDGSLQSILNLQHVLHSLYGLKFDEEKTQSLEYRENTRDLQPQNLMFL